MQATAAKRVKMTKNPKPEDAPDAVDARTKMLDEAGWRFLDLQKCDEKLAADVLAEAFGAFQTTASTVIVTDMKGEDFERVLNAAPVPCRGCAVAIFRLDPEEEDGYVMEVVMVGTNADADGNYVAFVEGAITAVRDALPVTVDRTDWRITTHSLPSTDDWDVEVYKAAMEEDGDKGDGDFTEYGPERDVTFNEDFEEAYSEQAEEGDEVFVMARVPKFSASTEWRHKYVYSGV